MTDEVMRAHVQVLHENIHLLLPLIQGFASQAPPADNAWPMLAPQQWARCITVVLDETLGGASTTHEFNTRSELAAS